MNKTTRIAFVNEIKSDPQMMKGNKRKTEYQIFIGSSKKGRKETSL